MSRLPHLGFLLLLGTCAPARDDAGVMPVRARRDAFPIANYVPATVGGIGSRMGTVTALCDGEFMASGVDGLVWAENNVVNLGVMAPEASVISCANSLFGGGTHSSMAGGPSGLWDFTALSIDWEQRSDAGLSSIDRHPTEETWLVARSTSVEVFGVATTGLLMQAVSTARWGPGGRTFAVARADRAALFSYATGQAPMPLGTFDPPPARAFDDEVAVGEFNPLPGLEVAVTLSNGGVAVYNRSSSRPLYVLREGSALATDEGYLGGLDSLLVGEPANELVRRWVGDASVEDWYLDGGGSTEFGFSVAADSVRSAYLVGAPGHTSTNGAVYLLDLQAPTPLGQPLECDVLAPCFPPSGTPGQCRFGACVGGVICEATSADCPPGADCVGDVCVWANDAGASPGDAGAVDAGPADAGADAGLDAGTTGKDGGAKEQRDAGDAPPADFVAIGCPSCASVTGGEVMLVAALGWLAARRRRHG